jgi:SHS2 domain-containing protein
MSYRWLEHTSELELQIDAPSELAAFELALVALGELVGDRCDGERDGGGASGADSEADGQRELVREVTVVASDRAALFATFLEELVYLVETDDLVPEHVEHLVLDGERLTATVRGHRGRPRHLVKGVTYHELTFGPVGDGFAATVVLDV